ncbi:uncharacterized protein METZ01_LOCUS501692, partial [marine metagenome]
SLTSGQTLTDSFNYTVSDPDGGTDVATIVFTINGVGDDTFTVFGERTVSNPSSISDLTATVSDSDAVGTSNNTIATAQSVAISDFIVTNGNDVEDAGDPRAIIKGKIDSNNDIDFYKFPVLSGDKLVFDIDFAQRGGLDPVDTQLHLFNSSNALVAYNDDTSRSTGGTGSTHSYDSFIRYTATQDENLYLSVTSYNNDGVTGGTFNHRGYSSGDYALNVSLERSTSTNYSLAD